MEFTLLDIVNFKMHVVVTVYTVLLVLHLDQGWVLPTTSGYVSGYRGNNSIRMAIHVNPKSCHIFLPGVDRVCHPCLNAVANHGVMHGRNIAAILYAKYVIKSTLE